MKRFFSLVMVLAIACAGAPPALARSAWDITADLVGVAAAAARNGSEPSTVPKGAQVEIGFSPSQGALPLVLKTINAARSKIDISAYSFTSSDVTRSLLAAAKRGVTVRLMVDHKHNFTGDSRKPLAAMSALSLAGVEVRSVNKYTILHDKFVIADSQHVQTGSFNYSRAADVSNSENVIVLWNSPATAKQYTEHFERNWALGARFDGR